MDSPCRLTMVVRMLFLSESKKATTHEKIPSRGFFILQFDDRMVIERTV